MEQGFNDLVIAARCASSWVGRYMMMPTQQKRSLSDLDAAGLMPARELRVQRCSIGAGVGRSDASIMPSRSLMYPRSQPFGAPTAPQGKQTSDTHCWPPHSNPRMRSDLHTRVRPKVRAVNS